MTVHYLVTILKNSLTIEAEVDTIYGPDAAARMAVSAVLETPPYHMADRASFAVAKVQAII